MRKMANGSMVSAQTKNPRRPSRRFVVVVTLVLVTAGLGITVGAATQGREASEREIRAALDQYSLDPRIAALGAVSQRDVVALSRSRAELLNAILDLAKEDESFTAFAFGNSPRESLEPNSPARSRPELLDFIEIQKELDVAVEELYDRASKADLAVGLQESWRQCMRDRGHNFDSPTDMETAISDGSLNFQRTQIAIRDRDECTVDLETDFEYFLLTEFIPDWSDDNSDLLDRYRQSFDPVSDN